MYVYKIRNRMTSKIKTGYYLELLSLETKKLLGSTDKKISTDKSGENMSYLQITGVVLVHCNTVNNDDQHDSGVLHNIVLCLTYKK